MGIPTGTYTTLVIGIDYSIPLVYLNGNATAATVENSAGTADPGIIYVTVKLDPSHPLVVGYNQSTPLALDFNLAASNNIAPTTNTVVVRPFVEAATPSNDTEPVRARGLIVVANPGQNNFVEDLRPFEDNVYSTVGALTVNTTATTYFNIDGTVLTGHSRTGATQQGRFEYTDRGLRHPGGTSRSNRRSLPGFTATQVYAGTVVSNGEYEHVRGIVTAKSGDTLSVVGATYLYYEGYCQSNLCFTYYPNATIDFGLFHRRHRGQCRRAGFESLPAVDLGRLAGRCHRPRLDQQLQLPDARCHVRTGAAAVHPGLGHARSPARRAPPRSTCSRWETRTSPASIFNFAGTGTSSANDAPAVGYAVDTTGATTGADQSATPAGTLLRVDGFPTPFGTAPPDFTATDVIPGTSAARRPRRAMEQRRRHHGPVHLL